MPDVAPRLKPACAEDEAYLLGMMMISQPAAEALLGTLTPDDFYTTAHRVLFTVMQMLETEGEPLPFSNVALVKRLAALNRLDQCAAYNVASCLANVWEDSAYHAPAQRVRTSRQKRQLLALADGVSDLLCADHSIDDALAYWNEGIASIFPAEQGRTRGFLNE